MTTIIRGITGWLASLVDDWDKFWFTPSKPHTLCVIRICTGGMMLYTHAVWAYGSAEWFGPNSWIPVDTARATALPYAWSHLFYVESPAVLMALHIAALVVFLLLTLGLFSRVMSVAAWLLTVAYCHRMQGALFGLDQINAILGMYLMVGPCGAVFSLDSWLKNRRSDKSQSEKPLIAAPAVSTNIAIRLMQLHLCVIYLFSGIGKTKGGMWWDGSATWFSIANYEYQSLDMTWLASAPWLLALLSHITIFWEIFYCALIWPRRTRPIMLAIAVGVHLGIASFLGMITFGTIMIVANMSFVQPEAFEWLSDRIFRRNASASPASSGVAALKAPKERAAASA